MAPRIAFRKVTPDGLSVDIEQYENLRLLLLTKELPGKRTQAVQVIGVAVQELNSPTITWYYEYEPLPQDIPLAKVNRWLQTQGYLVGVFDQFGNFQEKAA